MWIPAALAALLLIPTHTWVSKGPVLSGTRVVWATNGQRVYTSSPKRRLWHPGRVSVPADAQLDPQSRYVAEQQVSDLASSASTTIFIRTVGARRIPPCVSESPPCLGGPLRTVPFRGELWVRRGSGPFRRLEGGAHRPLVIAADVDGQAVVLAEDGDVDRVVLRLPNVPPQVLTSSTELGYPRVAVAGRFAAWLEGNEHPTTGYPLRSLVVYDIRARRVAYRLASAPVTDLDLAPDGTVAFGQDPTPAAGPNGGVGWASVAEPWPHFLAGDAIPFRVRLAAGRVAFFTGICCPREPRPLVVETLDGRITNRLPAAYGDFDFDGQRLAYLKSVRVIAVARIR
jgi:hypothetical protein